MRNMNESTSSMFCLEKLTLREYNIEGNPDDCKRLSW